MLIPAHRNPSSSSEGNLTLGLTVEFLEYDGFPGSKTHGAELKSITIIIIIIQKIITIKYNII